MALAPGGRRPPGRRSHPLPGGLPTAAGRNEVLWRGRGADGDVAGQEQELEQNRQGAAGEVCLDLWAGDGDGDGEKAKKTWNEGSFFRGSIFCQGLALKRNSCNPQEVGMRGLTTGPLSNYGYVFRCGGTEWRSNQHPNLTLAEAGG